MKLLIVTQKLDQDDDAEGYLSGWIEEFAQQVERVIVVCRIEGKHRLPENVFVEAQGNFVSMIRTILKKRNDYDAALLFGLNPRACAGVPLWLLLQKRVGIWDGAANKFWLMGRVGAILGPGIDTDVFRPAAGRAVKSVFDIVSVGDMDRLHDFETLLAAAKTLHGWGKRFSVRIFGGAHAEREKLRFNQLTNLVRESDLAEHVEFQGGVPNRELSKYVRGSDLFVGTDSGATLSRSTLEAMACGVPSLTSNKAMADALGGYREALQYARGDSMQLAEKISWAIGLSRRERDILGRDLRDIVIRRYDLRDFISRILAAYRKI